MVVTFVSMYYDGWYTDFSPLKKKLQLKITIKILGYKNYFILAVMSGCAGEPASYRVALLISSSWIRVHGGAGSGDWGGQTVDSRQ